MAVSGKRVRYRSFWLLTWLPLLCEHWQSFSRCQYVCSIRQFPAVSKHGCRNTVFHVCKFNLFYNHPIIMCLLCLSVLCLREITLVVPRGSLCKLQRPWWRRGGSLPHCILTWSKISHKPCNLLIETSHRVKILKLNRNEEFKGWSLYPYS